jgi:ABC-2 type transport system ATP-binding protein
VAGHDVLEDSIGARLNIGYLPENSPLYAEMRVRDFLRFVGKARGLSPAKLRDSLDRVVDLVQIERMLKKNVAHLSRGYRQRVALAQALIHDPPILILDEPTSGLDPHQIIEIRELLRELGKTKVIVFSSHILQEISSVCTRIIIIKDGRLVADGKPADLEAQATGHRAYRARIQGPDSGVKEKLQTLGGVDTVEVLGADGDIGEYRISSSSQGEVGTDIFRAVVDSGWTLSALEPESRSLEEVYLRLTASDTTPLAAAG